MECWMVVRFVVSTFFGCLLICHALPIENSKVGQRRHCVSCLRDCPEALSDPSLYRRQSRSQPTFDANPRTTKKSENEATNSQLENVESRESRQLLLTPLSQIEHIVRSSARPVYEIDRQHFLTDRFSDLDNYHRSPRQKSFIIYRVDDGFVRTFSDGEFENYIKRIVGTSAPNSAVYNHGHRPSFTPEVRLVVHENPFRVNVLKDFPNFGSLLRPRSEYFGNSWGEGEEPISKHEKKALMYTVEKVDKDSSELSKKTSSIEEETKNQGKVKKEDTSKEKIQSDVGVGKITEDNLEIKTVTDDIEFSKEISTEDTTKVTFEYPTIQNGE